MKQSKLFPVAISLAILCIVAFAFVFRWVSVITERYHSALVTKNDATLLLAGTWVLQNSSTEMNLNLDGTGVFRSKSGEKCYFDWTCDSNECHFFEYNTPVVSLVKMRRIAAMDTSMNVNCSIVKLNENELELRYVADPSIVVRYTRLTQQ